MLHIDSSYKFYYFILIPMDKIKGIFVSFRPHQWTKNLFMFAPLIFSKKAQLPYFIFKETVGVILFSLLNGAVYIINDICDIEQDKHHPIKRNRPIASGVVSKQLGFIVGILLIITSLSFSFLISVNFFFFSFIYLIINLLYSLKLKGIPFIDVSLIAIGFGLRILGGAFIISVKPSYWLIICGMLLALFLAIGKRRHELNLENPPSHRTVLKYYSRGMLNFALYTTGIITGVVYLLYCLSPRTKHFFKTEYMVVTFPFVVFGLIRYIRLVNRKGSALSPTDTIIHDPPFIINLILWGLTVIAIIYF